MSLVLLAALGGLAFAADEPQQPSSAAVNEEQRRVCRSAPATGSILGRTRQCHTRAEWRRIDQANDDGTRATTDRTRNIRDGRSGAGF